MPPQSSPTRLIPLTRGLWALVDAADFPTLSTFKWSALKKGDAFYADRRGPRPKREHIRLHRVIVNAESGLSVDHLNGDTLDNRRCNLRFATTGQNNSNRRPGPTNTTGFKGVWFDKNTRSRWRACIEKAGHVYRLGSFASAEDAARAYDTAARQLHGVFARLNFP